MIYPIVLNTDTQRSLLGLIVLVLSLGLMETNTLVSSRTMNNTDKVPTLTVQSQSGPETNTSVIGKRAKEAGKVSIVTHLETNTLAVLRMIKGAVKVSTYLQMEICTSVNGRMVKDMD